MKLSKVLFFSALAFVCSIIQSASASVLGNLESGLTLPSTDRRVFKQSKDSEQGSTGSGTNVKGRKVWPATIKFSSFGVATLYINGIIYSKLFSPHPWSMTVNLAKGDVVAVKAEKTDYRVGVMVTIVWRGRTYRSGGNVFKVRSDSFFNWNANEQDAWNRAVRDSKGKPKLMTPFCSWKSADVLDFKKNKFDRKASYIWSLHSSHKHNVLSKTPAQTVYIRHVIGGEKCPKNIKSKNAKTEKKQNTDDDGEKKKVTKEKTTGATAEEDDKEVQKVETKKSEEDQQSSTDVGIGGQSDTRTCKCRLVSIRGGTCFDMVTPGDDEGPCTARPCDRQYECAHDGDKDANHGDEIRT